MPSSSPTSSALTRPPGPAGPPGRSRRARNRSACGGNPPPEPAGPRGSTNRSAISTTSPSTRPGTATISPTRRGPSGSSADVHDEVDRRRDRRDDEPRRDVLAGQQRKRAHLDDRLAGGVGVDGAHPGQPGVERDEQVEALGLAHLADHDAGRPHPQRLLDQPAQRHLAGALEAGLPALHARHVAQRDPQLEHLLAGDHPLARGNGRRQAVEHRRLAGLGAAGHQDVEAGHDGRLEEVVAGRGERARAGRGPRGGRP